MQIVGLYLGPADSGFALLQFPGDSYANQLGKRGWKDKKPNHTKNEKRKQTKTPAVFSVGAYYLLMFV